ncbi:MAG TPA: hypothetical protein VHN14_33205 [Kofleriaceae bacterium]|nr:hypothetical protein [Kofleriaceae bacterium]
MRKLPPGVALSTIFHAVVVAWVATHVSPPSLPAEAASTTAIEIVTVDQPPVTPIAPIEVALADERPAPVVRPPATPPPASHSRGRAPPPAPSISTPGSPPGAGAGAEIAPVPPPERSTWMAMRRQGAPRPVLPAGRWDDLDHVPRGTIPAKDLTTGILDESGGGTHQSDQGVFVGKVSPDGSVKLSDRPNFHAHFALPTPKDLGRALAGWYESDKGPYGAEGDTAMARQIQVSPGASTEPPDLVEPRPKDRTTTVIVPVIAGGFDTTDWLMRRHGQDPYARKKLAFLDATRDERVQIGNRHRAMQLALTPQIVQKNLDALWAATQDLRTRKQALFALWDECVETGDPGASAGGEAARRLIIGFIRGHLPAGGPDAFTPAELAELARTQQSKTVFRPYD